MAQVIENGCQETAVEKLGAEVAKLEVDYTHAKVSANGGPCGITEPKKVTRCRRGDPRDFHAGFPQTIGNSLKNVRQKTG
jgi:hypothetical protein